MNWLTFLLNQFLIDCEEAQDKGTEFHYSWLLILIALSMWMEPDDTIFWRQGEAMFSRMLSERLVYYA